MFTGFGVGVPWIVGREVMMTSRSVGAKVLPSTAIGICVGFRVGRLVMFAGLDVGVASIVGSEEMLASSSVGDKVLSSTAVGSWLTSSVGAGVGAYWSQSSFIGGHSPVAGSTIPQ